MTVERPPRMALGSIDHKLLDILAEYAPETTDGVVISEFVDNSLLPKFKEDFKTLPTDKQYYIALFNKLPKEVLLDMVENRSAYLVKKGDADDSIKRYRIGAHDIGSTIFMLHLLTGTKIKDREV